MRSRIDSCPETIRGAGPFASEWLQRSRLVSYRDFIRGAVRGAVGAQATMLQAQENSKSNDSGDPHGVWSSKIFAAICIAVGVSTLALAVVMVFVGGAAAPTSKMGRGAAAEAETGCGAAAEAETGHGAAAAPGGDGLSAPQVYGTCARQRVAR